MAKTAKAAKPAKKAAPKKAAKAAQQPRPGSAPAPAAPASLAREHLPIPDPKHIGLTTYDAKDPEYKVSTDQGAATARRRAQRPDRPHR